MGLSSSKQKTKNTSSESATTTPTIPDWIDEPLQQYTGTITNRLAADPSIYVAPASPLQQQAFAAVNGLGSWKPTMIDAIAMARDAATTAAPAAAASTYQAPSATASTYEVPQLGGAQRADVFTYDAPRLADVPQVDSLDLARIATGRPESLLDGFNRYLDPATRQLVDAALATYDAQTGRGSAALAAQGARAGAFGGSRFAIREGEFAADSDRNRALTEAELRARAFSQGAQLADEDAARRQNVGLFNAGAENARSLAQVQVDLERLLRNAGLKSEHDLNQAGLAADAARANAAALNSNSMFNADLGSKHNLAQAELEAAARQFNAGVETGVSQSNAAQAADASQFNARAQAGVSQFNAAQAADAATRALETARLVGTLGTNAAANARADIGLVGDLGDVQHLIDQAYASAPLTQLQAAAQLYGALPYSSYTGRQMSGNSSGTTTSTSTPSLFNQALAAAAAAAAL